MKIGPIVISVKWVGLDTDWKKLARNGRKIDAIKALRDQLPLDKFDYPLNEAKGRVDAYLSKLK